MGKHAVKLDSWNDVERPECFLAYASDLDRNAAELDAAGRHEEAARQHKKAELLHKKADTYAREFRAQRKAIDRARRASVPVVAARPHRPATARTRRSASRRGPPSNNSDADGESDPPDPPPPTELNAPASPLRAA